MRQLKKYGLYMLLAAILLLTAACGRNNTNNGTTADDNMAGTTEDSNQTNENVDINDILFDTDGDGVYESYGCGMVMDCWKRSAWMPMMWSMT